MNSFIVYTNVLCQINKVSYLACIAVLFPWIILFSLLRGFSVSPSNLSMGAPSERLLGIYNAIFKKYRSASVGLNGLLTLTHRQRNKPAFLLNSRVFFVRSFNRLLSRTCEDSYISGFCHALARRQVKRKLRRPRRRKSFV